MAATPTETAIEAVQRFRIDGQLTEFRAFDRGHLHDTFIATWRRSDGTERRFLHQRMNDSVFRDIPGLMHNIELVTQRLAATTPADSHLRTLSLVRASDGATFVTAPDGHWRTYVFIEGTESHDLCDSPERAREAARAFGDFQAGLIGLDAGLLKETIPNFFSSPHRLRQFDMAHVRDGAERAARVRDELAFVRARRDVVRVVDDLLRSGKMPMRIVHGDTKLNNVLFDDATGRAVCVVDLDTCMAGYSLYDFGDLVRFTAATCREDETDLSLAGMDLGLYRALVDGYLETAQRFLTTDEIALMPFSARLVTFTCGLRFLTDYLAGDVYFKTSRPDHNLDRARVQFAIVESMERQVEQMVVTPTSTTGRRLDPGTVRSAAARHEQSR